MRSLLACTLLTCLVTSCTYDPGTRDHEGLRSDGYIRYTYNGNNVILYDSIYGGDPAYFLLSGYYYRHDTLLILTGSTSQTDERINIELENCLDTGIFDKGLYNASITQTTSKHTWYSDLKHAGQVHLTQFDTVNGLASGTFKFEAVTTNLPVRDSIFVDSGFFFHFPILMAQ
ncbi:MAG: DUF6252 family protein [Bacteroidota bacterium]|nr:DUF6252 family protein [Bacteroidota bacterium]MDP4237077.1 DUF6252 family protein [Bacteroidota bacterium]